MEQRCEFCGKVAQETSDLGTHFCFDCMPHFLEAACKKCNVRCVHWQKNPPVTELPTKKGLCTPCFLQQNIESLSDSELKSIEDLLRADKFFEALELSPTLVNLPHAEHWRMIVHLDRQIKGEHHEPK